MEAHRHPSAARSCFALAALVLGLFVAQTTPAAAEPKDDAKKLLARGDELLKKGDYYTRRNKVDKAVAEYEHALAAYQLAYDLVTDSRIYFPIAAAEEKLGHYLDAVGHYKKVIAEGGEGLEPTLRERALAGIEALKQYLGVLTLVIVPEGAAVTLDGVDLGLSPLSEAQIVAPGEHTVAVTAEGYTPFEITLTLEAGSESERSVELEEIPVIVEPPRKPHMPKPKPALEPRPSRTLLYGLSTASAGLVLTGAITGVMAVSRHGTATDTSLAADDRDTARSSGKTLALVTDLSLAAGIGLGVYAFYYVYKVYRPEVAARQTRNADRLAAWRRDQQVGDDAAAPAGGASPHDGAADGPDDDADVAPEDEPTAPEGEAPMGDEGGDVLDPSGEDAPPLGGQLWFAPFASDESFGLAVGGSF